MGNIGSYVDLTSGWRGHQANIEADGASRSGNWSDGDFAPAMAGSAWALSLSDRISCTTPYQGLMPPSRSPTARESRVACRGLATCALKWALPRQFLCRRARVASATKPTAVKRKETGSGTGSPVTRNAPVRVPVPTIQAPGGGSIRVAPPSIASP